MRYLNFDLELARCAKDAQGNLTYEVRASQTPRAEAQFEPDLVSVEAGELSGVMETLAKRFDVDEAAFAKACETIGNWLLPPGSKVQSYLRSSLGNLAENEGLLVRLRCREDALARIPWEFAAFAIDGMQRDGLFHVDRMLAMHPKVCLSRFDEISTPIERPSAGAARRQLLFVSAAPPDTRPLALGLERQRIEEALREAQTTPAAEWIEHITPRGLQQRLMNARIDVFQFSGHGGSSSGGYLCFEPDEDVATIEADQLALLLAGKGVRLAVLAACVTAEIESQLPWNSVARTLVAGGVPAVVGMQFNITDQGALAYLSTFYRALARSLTICDAVTEGRKSIVLNPRSARDFGVPVLYLRNADNWDGILFPTSSPVRDESPIEANIRAADAYKRFHDALHTAKMSAFNLLLRFANDFPPKQAGEGRS